MVNISTQYAGLSLRNPIIVASSGLTNNAERNKEFEKAGAAAIVLKSLFEEQIENQSQNIIDQSQDYPEAADYIQGYVKANQINSYLQLIEDTKKVCTIPVIASINCYKADAWIDFAKKVEQAGADALELNVFFLETDLVFDGNKLQTLYADIVRKVKQTISIPVIVKLGKMVGNVPALVQTLKVNGADGVVLFNRPYQPDININTMQIVSGNVFSSHSDLSDTLRWTAIVAGKVPGLPVASSTGVHDWEDVIKCLLAGASAVEICSTLYTHGPEVISQILTCLEEWMNQTKYKSLNEFIGKLSYTNAEDPAIYERAQFMKYFSNRD